jgi:lysophospholipase L1-like esterase
MTMAARARRRALMLLALAAVGLQAAVACATEETTYSGAAHAPKVAVIGDSITWMSADAIHDTLDPSYAVEITGVVGATARLQVHGTDIPEFHQAAATEPDIVIINLGTNDTDESAEDILDDLSRARALFPSAACYVPVTLTTHGVGTFRSSSKAALYVNQVLPREHLADWASAVDAHPSLVGPDGVHPTGDGSVALAALYKSAADSCAPPASR